MLQTLNESKNYNMSIKTNDGFIIVINEYFQREKEVGYNG